MNGLKFLCVLIFALALVEALPKKDKIQERTDENGVTWVGPIRKCPKGNNAVIDDCLRKIVKDLTPQVGSGLSALDVEPLDPILIEKFNYDRSLGPINITLNAKNTQIHGFTNFKMLKFRTDLKNMKMRFLYEVPHIKVETENYKLGGNVFFFPLVGSGPARFEIFNLRAEGEMQGKLARNEDGEEIMQVEKITYQNLSIGDMNLVIRGLFEGNALLSSVVHYIGKRYASQVFQVIRPDIEEFSANLIAHDLLNPALSRLPYVAEYVRT